MSRVLVVAEPGHRREALVRALAGDGFDAQALAPTGHTLSDETLGDAAAVVFAGDEPLVTGALTATLRRHRDLPVVAVSDTPDVADAFAQREDGWAMLPSRTSPRVIAAAVVAASAGLVTTRLNVANRGEDAGVEAGLEPLTPREREVLALLADGLSNRGIAARLGISEHTVKVHVSTIYAKLGAANRAEAVALGLQRGWVAL